jgi:hypothetical protein
MLNPKRLRVISLSLSSVLFLTTGLLADMQKRNLYLASKVKFNDVVLEPGTYKVEVQEKAGFTELLIYKGKKIVARANAEPKKQDTQIQQSSIRLERQQGDLPKVVEMQMVGDSNTYHLKSSHAEANVSRPSEGAQSPNL